MTPEEIDALQLLAGDIAKPLNEYLIADICRRVKKAGAITDTAEYQIYRAEALGMARDAIAKAVAKQMGASEQAISALFETLADKTVAFQDNGVLQQLVAAYAKITTKGTSDILKDLWAPGPDKKMYTVDEIYGRC
ncbi:MAG: phage minor capsid protein, partial [Ruthenibacterium sp.]